MENQNIEKSQSLVDNPLMAEKNTEVPNDNCLNSPNMSNYNYGNIDDYKAQVKSFNEPSNYGENNSFSNNDLISSPSKGERKVRTLKGEYEGDYLQPEADLTITETGSIVDAQLIRCNSLILNRGTIKSQTIEVADTLSITGKKGLELDADINTLQLILENPYQNEKTGEIVYRPFKAHIKITFIE